MKCFSLAQPRLEVRQAFQGWLQWPRKFQSGIRYWVGLSAPDKLRPCHNVLGDGHTLSTRRFQLSLLQAIPGQYTDFGARRDLCVLKFACSF